jgi:bifunctional non-homologous end joining protein LigD
VGGDDDDRPIMARPEMEDPLAGLPEQARRRLVATPQPSWVEPMLATLTSERFSDSGWLFEPKWDGERCLAFRHGSEIRLLSRNRKLLNVHYPELVDALAGEEAGDFVVDGEIVTFEDGRTSFARLQHRMQVQDPRQARHTGVEVWLYLFDVLHVDGYDLTRLALRDRKPVLRRLLGFRDPVRYTPHRDDGEAYWREACAKGWEGLIAKRAAASYAYGRSHDWLKFKCVNEQEFVIGGYTEPKGSRRGLGALLLGYYDGDDLVYAGKVGTGFNEELLERLHARLETIEVDRQPFTRGQVPAAGAHWVRPELVAEVGFSEWTADGRLRHPRFIGLRDDKPARAVVRERPR